MPIAQAQVGRAVVINHAEFAGYRGQILRRVENIKLFIEVVRITRQVDTLSVERINLIGTSINGNRNEQAGNKNRDAGNDNDRYLPQVNGRV